MGNYRKVSNPRVIHIKHQDNDNIKNYFFKIFVLFLIKKAKNIIVLFDTFLTNLKKYAIILGSKGDFMYGVSFSYL